MEMRLKIHLALLSSEFYSLTVEAYVFGTIIAFEMIGISITSEYSLQ